ncbi:transcriptional regulator [Hydrococcus rivularis NIES-593]|uniref:Transcriptional regulator n=1 Tax=Hydrococcus rivularis NIES-593 TaxID=1921803 RepID=A0A1U7HRM4_9CYAN|nr:helix-turn-helix transcriptional regulator [Hydrococcus rivularis]OKH26217.1 transcriptional regulator [Hydrococcus rivularis NIES-593]
MSITRLFGENIRRLRVSQGLSQDALADKAGLHRTYVGAVERGERNITLINAEKIANALGVSLVDCLRDKENSDEKL